MNNKVVLGLGGNIGDVKSTLETAHELIDLKIGDILLQSNYYKTEAWGVENQPDFLNQVIQVSTIHEPTVVLRKCLEIEQELGRDRVNQKKWNERTLDIDLLFYDDLVLKDKELTLPHPYLQERNFVLSPLIEILPNLVHPISKKTMLDLKKECNDSLAAIKI